jgi:hypothetical protein
VAEQRGQARGALLRTCEHKHHALQGQAAAVAAAAPGLGLLLLCHSALLLFLLLLLLLLLLLGLLLLPQLVRRIKALQPRRRQPLQQRLVGRQGGPREQVLHRRREDAHLQQQAAGSGGLGPGRLGLPSTCPAYGRRIRPLSCL